MISPTMPTSSSTLSRLRYGRGLSSLPTLATFAALATTPQAAHGRLGGGASASSASFASPSSSPGDSPTRAHPLFGYNYYASTSVYGDTPMTGCGELDTKELVAGTDYYAVASAQAMQDIYPMIHGGGCEWKCEEADGTPIDRCRYTHPLGTLSGAVAASGCSCVQLDSCMCGKAGPGAGTPNGTAPMGCFTCGRGRFSSRTPYELLAGSDDGPANETLSGPEIKIVVADVCPYGSNYKWCPARPGEVNAVGAFNHLDFATVPPLGDYFNNFFVFTPEPCSAEIADRMRSESTCPASTWPSSS